MRKTILRMNVFFTVLVVLLVSCSPMMNPNTPKLGNAGKTIELNPKLQFFRPSANQLLLYFSIESDKILFARESENAAMSANLRIICKGFNSESKEVFWEINQKFTIDKNNVGTKWIDYFDISEKQDYEGELLVTVADVNRGLEYTAYSNITKERIAAQYYLPLYPNQKTAFVSDYYFVNDSIGIKKSTAITGKTQINYLQVPKQQALPPFSEAIPQQKIITNKSLLYPNDSIIATISPITQPTLLEIKNSNNSNDVGLILPFFKPNFPELFDGEDMVYPLVYITTKAEFQQLLAAENPRKAAEAFWLSKCKSKDRARAILGEYYRRVVESNKFFTSFIEGWKSDRGMIFLIFGKPESITKRGNQEIWTYGREINTVRLSFTFLKKPSLYSFNHYELERNSGYKSVWDLATNSWRNGRIFSY